MGNRTGQQADKAVHELIILLQITRHDLARHGPVGQRVNKRMRRRGGPVVHDGGAQIIGRGAG